MLRNVCRLAKCAISKVNTKMKAERLQNRRKGVYRTKDDRLFEIGWRPEIAKTDFAKRQACVSQ